MRAGYHYPAICLRDKACSVCVCVMGITILHHAKETTAKFTVKLHITEHAYLHQFCRWKSMLYFNAKRSFNVFKTGKSICFTPEKYRVAELSNKQISI